MTDDLHLMPAREVLGRFQRRELSPVEYLDALFSRIDMVEPQVGAVAFRFDERAREAARAAETAYMSRSADVRPLEGLPVAIKDDTEIAGDPCTMGSLVWKDRVASETAPVAERILESGAIPHVRTRTSEFCLIGQCHSRLWGVTRNPWNPAFDVGGSSGGSAAALISGMAPLANGSDVGGSIRIPASCCGIVGYKPPYGRVPLSPPANLDTYLH
ncbi:MAG: amidase, partial [Chloroflexota bacterium]|nr:amidase [Chloroflexota bacterium]